jgi:hypothetical protein
MKSPFAASLRLIRPCESRARGVVIRGDLVEGATKCERGAWYVRGAVYARGA